MEYKLTEKIIKIIGNDPVFSVRMPVTPLFMLITWQTNKMPRPLYVYCVSKGRDTIAMLNEKEYIAIATDKFKKYFEGGISLEELQKEYYDWDKFVSDLYNKLINLNISKLSDDEIVYFFNELNKVAVGLADITLYIENVDYEKILSVMGGQNKEKLDKIWNRAIEAVFLSFEMRRLGIMLDLVKSNSNNIIRQAKFIFTDYFWTKSDSEIESNLKEIKDNYNAKKIEFENTDKEMKSKMSEHAKWLNSLDAESKKIAEFTQLVMHMRDIRKDPIAKWQAMMAELSVEAVNRAGIDKKFSPYVLLYEYMKGIGYLKSNRKDIENRIEGCIYMAKPDMSSETENCNFERAVAELMNFIESKNERVSTLNGQIACRGKVSGIARVVFDPHDDKGFQKGDILITSMTRPEFVPLMKKAGAVVTNEGGITCHAAIISRELGIPCVIGTKSATRSIKDGDIVEVDAEKGVVRIIN